MRAAHGFVAAVGLLAGLCFAEPASAFTWGLETVPDPSPSVGLSSSLALDASGLPHISYADTTNADLKYAAKACWSIPLAKGPITWCFWTVETVDSVGSESTSLALDAGGLPHIAYHDYTNNDLRYAHRLSTSTWVVETVDSAGNVGAFASLALDASGLPHIAYRHSGERSLKYARKVCRVVWLWTTPVTLCFWSIEHVELGPDTGYFPSLALDSTGLPHIVYTDDGHFVKYARKLGAGGWLKETIAVSEGPFSLALDSADQPHVAYLSASGIDLVYAHRLPGGPWSAEVVGPAVNTSQLSLALDSGGLPHISYHNIGNLQYAGQLAPGSWSIEIVDLGGNAGRQSSIALDGSDRPHISYEFGFPAGDLRYASGF
jgi:hypothetical protein